LWLSINDAAMNLSEMVARKETLAVDEINNKTGHTIIGRFRYSAPHYSGYSVHCDQATKQK
jgi:hypothetical protein